METQLNFAPKHTRQTGGQKMEAGGRCSGLIRRNFKYLAAAEGSLLTEGLEEV